MYDQQSYNPSGGHQADSKSPSGALFPYYYKNGELFGIHLGSYFSDEEGVIAMMKAEADFFTGKHRPMGVWIDFYETKLGLVGCSTLSRWKIHRLIRKRDLLSTLPVKYFEDPEVAKTWLVSELE